MESKIFAKLNFDPGILVIASLVATIILIIVVLILILKQSRLEVNYKIFMRGKGGRSLQEVFKQELEGLDIIREQTDLLHKRLTYVEKSLNRSYQKCGIVKYDAFKEMGGQLSFALALLNDSNTGFVINCIHSRDGSYTYIKDIVRGECAIELCDEEKEALKIALETSGSNPAVSKTEKKQRRRTVKTAAPSETPSASSAAQTPKEPVNPIDNNKTVLANSKAIEADKNHGTSKNESSKTRETRRKKKGSSIKRAVFHRHEDD